MDRLEAQREETAPLKGRTWLCRTLAGLLILAAAGLRVAYLAWDCPLDLAPDEAHYWDWSRHLDWSYYSKGPLVAYLIHLGCWLLGDWSRALTGSEMLAVRTPAILCGSLMLVSLYVLTVQVFRRERLALAVVAMALTLPVIAAGATLMTIDAPFTCLWGWALVLGYQAVFRGSTWAWPLLGVVIGLGILAKYTMVLWVPCLMLFLLMTPPYRRLLLSRGFWVMAGIAALGCLPIVIWNAQHDWVTLRHARGHAGLGAGTSAWDWLGPVHYVSLQFLLLLGFWFLAWLCTLVAHRPWRRRPACGGDVAGEPPAPRHDARPEVAYLWWLSLPIFLFFLLFSLKNGGGEPNWPIAAYLSGLVLTVAWLARQLQDPRSWCRRMTLAWLTAFCGVGLVLTVALHESQLLHPLLAKVAGPPTRKQSMPLRRLDPTCRLRGWRTLAAEVDRLRLELRATGIEPVLAASGWNLPGEIGFYCDGQPQVYSLGLALGDRHSQYDLWRPNPVDDMDAFAGRTFIIVGGGVESYAAAFDQVDGPHFVVHREKERPVARWTVLVGRGFRGFPNLISARQSTW